jgi:DedD protein
LRRGAFEDEELEPVKPRRDTELTLSSGVLLAIFLGLAMLLVFCFGLGYVVGRRGLAPAAALPTPSQPIAGSNALAKPPATAQLDQSQPPESDSSTSPPPATVPTANPAAGGQAPAASAAGAPDQPSVHPALESASLPGKSAQAAPPAAAVQPAMPQAAPAPAGSLPAGSPPAASLMVQIAAVSQAEDANVLTEALRKRGYAATARRDPTDNLIHVRIGPFATLTEANSWRMKLLNDGYNAVVQQ